MAPKVLNKDQRRRARRRAAEAALLAYCNRFSVHYTQGWRRWDGIRLHKNARQGQYPNYADCSAFATWCLWNGLYIGYGQPDTVNRANWQAGFTGTLMAFGKPISILSAKRDMLTADVVLYGYYGSTPTHAAICVGRLNGMPMVVSHGSESGPFYLPYNYRRIVGVRRFIYKGI